MARARAARRCDMDEEELPGNHNQAIAGRTDSLR